MIISLLDSVLTKVPTKVELDGFDDLVKWLITNSKPVPSKKEGQLWSPCEFTGKSKQEADALQVGALVLDFDADKPDLTLIDSLGLGYFWHKTYTENKSRLVIAIDKPVPTPQWAKFWANATSMLDFTTHDASCKNASRFYFLPVGKEYIHKPGRAIPVDEILNAQSQKTTQEDIFQLRQALLKTPKQERAAQVRLALEGKPIAQEGNRDNTVTGLGWYLGRFVVPDGYSFAAVHSLLHRGLRLPGPETKEYWETKFKKAYEEGRKERLEKQAVRTGALQLDKEWAAQLQLREVMGGGQVIIPNTHNASVILENEGTFQFRENMLEGCLEYAHGTDFRRFDDVAATDISNWLQRSFRISLSRNQIFEQVEALSRKNRYDPVADYLNSLKWDGQIRAENFLTDYLGADEVPIYYAYSKKFLVSLVARALRPGCKVDTVLTLRGPQGYGKSTALRALCEPWFSDTKIVIGDKDSYALASSSWLHEFAELAALKRSDLETTKAFFSAQEDYYRPPFARTHVKRPRRCVFVATTNESQFLRDPTGNRRWWVVNIIKPINVKRLRADRDQLMAEAVHLFNAGMEWHLDSSESVLHNDAVSDFVEDDLYQVDHEMEALRTWWNALPAEARPQRISVNDVLTRVLAIEPGKVPHGLVVRLTRALQVEGFKRTRSAVDGRRVWQYMVPVSWFTLKAVASD